MENNNGNSRESWYYSILKHLPHSVVMTDQSGEIIDWIGSSEKIFGYTKEEALDCNISMLHEVDEGYLQDVFQKLNTDGYLQEDIHCKKKDGSKIIVNQMVICFHQNKQEFEKYLWINIDVTEKRNKEKLAKELEIKLSNNQRMESLGNLAASIAHDFNNLFMGVIGYTSLILDMMDRENYLHPMIIRIQETIEQATFLSNQMLALADDEHYNKEVVNLNKSILDLGVLLKSSISSNISISYDLEEDLPKILSNGSQIKHVLINLITNAQESIEKIGKIKIKTYSKNEHNVVLEIVDNGCGMSSATLERAFEPFYTEKQKGRGLGLSVVDRIIKKNNGCIEIHSQLGEGTSIRVIFPITEKEKIEAINKIEMKKINKIYKVLICDDEPIVLEIVGKMMDQMGFKSILTQNGNECIDVLDKNKDIDIILLDISMPDIDGIKILEKLRRRNINLPIILTSGYARSKISPIIIEQENVDFLQKPYRYEDLLKIISEWI